MSYDRSLNILLRLSGFSRETEPVGDTLFYIMAFRQMPGKKWSFHVFS